MLLARNTNLNKIWLSASRSSQPSGEGGHVNKWLQYNLINATVTCVPNSSRKSLHPGPEVIAATKKITAIFSPGQSRERAFQAGGTAGRGTEGRRGVAPLGNCHGFGVNGVRGWGPDHRSPSRRLC